MKVQLGILARLGIETALEVDVESGVRAALYHYAGKLQSGRLPIESPRFLPAQKLKGSDASLDLAVDSEVEAVLKQEAARQGTNMNELANHMVLVYLAELDRLPAPLLG